MTPQTFINWATLNFFWGLIGSYKQSNMWSESRIHNCFVGFFHLWCDNWGYLADPGPFLFCQTMVDWDEVQEKGWRIDSWFVAWWFGVTSLRVGSQKTPGSPWGMQRLEEKLMSLASAHEAWKWRICEAFPPPRFGAKIGEVFTPKPDNKWQTNDKKSIEIQWNSDFFIVLVHWPLVSYMMSLPKIVPKSRLPTLFFSLFVEVMLKMQREEVAEFVQHHFVPKSEWPRGMVKRLEWLDDLWIPYSRYSGTFFFRGWGERDFDKRVAKVAVDCCGLLIWSA